MYENEIVWENQMVDRGIDRYFMNIERAKWRQGEDGIKRPAKDESSTSYGVGLMREVFGPLKSCLDWFLANKLGGVGRPEISLVFLSKCDPMEAAYIAAKCIIDSISRVENQTSLAMRIGGHLEDNERLKDFQTTYDKYYRAVRDDMARRGVNDYRSKRRTFIKCHDKAQSEAGLPVWEPWSRRDRLHIGLTLIGMFIAATSDYKNGGSAVNNCYQEAERVLGSSFVERVLRHQRGRQMYYIVGTEKAAEYIAANMELCSSLQPDFLPTLIPPKDWSTPYDGGYHHPALRDRKPLVKTSRDHLRVLESAFMPEVYDAVNAAQAVPWEVNSFVFEQVLNEWGHPHGIGMPGRDPLEIPDCPLGELEQEDMTAAEYKAYRQAAAACLTPDEKAEYRDWINVKQEIEIREQERISKIINLSGTLRVARMMEPYDEFFFVHTLDYRGRMYSCGAGLNPQGTDMSKGLLKFARGTKLGLFGYWHLCIHAAGLYGVDKVSLEERVQWVHQHKAEIMATGLDPQDAREFWGSADKPYLFLAACEELSLVWLRYADVSTIVDKAGLEGYAADFVSHLPGSQDGSCNGIQHFSAMLKDPVGAQAVNMTGRPDVGDIYQETADQVIADLRTSLETGRVRNGNKLEAMTEEQRWLIDKLLNIIGITRKTTKKSTMVIPYGGTKRSCLASVKDYVVEKNEESLVFDNKQVYAAALMLHHYVWHALDTVVVAARKAMKFLREIVKVNNRLGLALQWTTPTGFIARQEIKDTREKKVTTQLFGKLQVYYMEETDELNKHKMASSFPPNFVHSMDSAHLMKTVNAGLMVGIEDFSLVHDSFGVPFGQLEAFHRAIRQQFVDIYSQNVLANLRLQQIAQFPDQEAVYPDPEDVKPGAYNIEEVNDALYFFR